jgi:hypothetical protein
MKTSISDQRPLRDVGRLAVSVMAGPVTAYLNHGSRHPTSVTQLRAEAAERPADALDAAVAAGTRMMAWIAVFLVSLPVFIVAAFTRRAVGTATDAVLVPIMAVTAFTGMFSSFSVLVQVGRITIARAIGWRGFPAATNKLSGKRRDDAERHRRSVIERRGPNRFVRWLSTPSHTDGVVALLWALMFTPLIVGGIH